MAAIRFIPAKALANRQVFASYMAGTSDPGFTGFSPGGTVAPYVSEELRRDDWVWFGTDNLWPQRALELIDNCIPLGRCVDTAALFIAGMGVEFLKENGDPDDDANERFQEWVSESSEEEFMERIARDVAALNAFSYDCTPLGDEGRRVGRIRHRDVSRIRLNKADEKGVIDTLWWSPDWTIAVKKSRSATGKLMAPVPKEALDLEKRQAIATAYVRGYKQGKDYYGEPWWIGGITDAENYVEVGRFNNSQLRTGFRAAMHAHFTTERDEKELDKLYDGIVANYTGSMADGLFITFGREGEPVVLNPVPRGDHAGELDLMREKAERAVVKAYGMSDVFYGLDAKTGMDGASAALQQAVEQWQRTWVEPRQKLVTRELTRLMNADGMTIWDCRIKPLKVVDAKADEVQDRQAYLRAVTVNEHRANRLDLPEIEGGEQLLISARAQSEDGQQEPA